MIWRRVLAGVALTLLLASPTADGQEAAGEAEAPSTEPGLLGSYEVVSTLPSDGPGSLLSQEVAAAAPDVMWARVVWVFEPDRCSVHGQVLGHDEAFGYHACDVEVEFEARWSDGVLVVPMSVVARGHFRRFEQRLEADELDTLRRSCSVSVPPGRYRVEEDLSGVALINETSGERLFLIVSDADPGYIHRLPDMR